MQAAMLGEQVVGLEAYSHQLVQPFPTAEMAEIDNGVVLIAD
jgi:hypothetical protein